MNPNQPPQGPPGQPPRPVQPGQMQPGQMQPGQMHPGQPHPGQPGAPQVEPEHAPVESLPYGQQLVDRGPTGPTKERTKSRLKLPGLVSVIYSSIYALILTAGIASSIFSFLAIGNALEATRTSGPSGGKTESGARAKMLAQERKKEEERREAEYQSARQALFANFGMGLVVICFALTGQVAGIVSGVNMLTLKSYRWAFRANIFSAIPFISTFTLVLFILVAERDILGGLIFLIFMIVYIVADAGRFFLSLFSMISLLSGYSRKFFDIK